MSEENAEVVLTAQGRKLFNRMINWRMRELELFSALGLEYGTWEGAIAEVKKIKQRLNLLQKITSHNAFIHEIDEENL